MVSCIARSTARLGEVVAVKTVRPDVLVVDPTALERLKSEIRLARRISHRNVVRTHDLGEADGIYFITMEYVTGTSLRELLDRGEPLPVPAVVAIAKQLCRALEVAHEQGVIHRDIKPQNLMVQPDGTLKVMDFGVARLRERTQQLTSTGMVVGTPAYMAPEQLMDGPVDARVDIYAAGVVLYECLTGHRPVDGSSPHVLMARMLSSAIRPPHEVNPACRSSSRRSSCGHWRRKRTTDRVRRESCRSVGAGGSVGNRESGIGNEHPRDASSRDEHPEGSAIPDSRFPIPIRRPASPTPRADIHPTSSASRCPCSAGPARPSCSRRSPPLSCRACG